MSSNILTIAGDIIDQISGTGNIVQIGAVISPVNYQSFTNTVAQTTIPSVLYWEYKSDPALQAFVDAYNGMAQQYVTWFATISLPVYAGNNQLTGSLLDWVLTGLYGIPRPTLPSTVSRALGPYNTMPYNVLPYDGYQAPEVTQVFITTDDIYKRIATWNLYRGDGQTFNIRWLKRRIQRFLDGVDGVDGSNAMGLGLGVDQTYSVSVSFSADSVVNITVSTTNGGYTTVWDTLKAAIEIGACQLPFQYTYNLV
jgi:hypothetical protein